MSWEDILKENTDWLIGLIDLHSSGKWAIRPDIKFTGTEKEAKKKAEELGRSYKYPAGYRLADGSNIGKLVHTG